MEDLNGLERHALVGSRLARTILTASTLVLILFGVVLVAQGVILSRSVTQVPLSARLLSVYAYQGYIVAGMVVEVGALVLMALQRRAGRMVLAVSSVVFLNLAFLWTSRGPGDIVAVNLIVSNLALAFVGVGVDTGLGIGVFDLVFLLALAITFSCVYLLSSGGRTGALLNSLIVASALMLLLSLEVYAWDRGELNLHFTTLSPPWFTNFVLAMSSSAFFLTSLCLRLSLRLRRRTG